MLYLRVIDARTKLVMAFYCLSQVVSMSPRSWKILTNVHGEET
jgi:hypothetical protein